MTDRYSDTVARDVPTVSPVICARTFNDLLDEDREDEAAREAGAREVDYHDEDEAGAGFTAAG